MSGLPRGRNIGETVRFSLVREPWAAASEVILCGFRSIPRLGVRNEVLRAPAPKRGTTPSG